MQWLGVQPDADGAPDAAAPAQCEGRRAAVDLTYAYGARSQISLINDQSTAIIDQTFTYDGLARLTASTGLCGARQCHHAGRPRVHV